MAKQTTNKPVARVNHGRISASIWPNESDKGTFYTITFQRSYRKDDQWKHTKIFGLNDLLMLSEVARKAEEKVRELIKEDRKQKAA